MSQIYIKYNETREGGEALDSGEWSDRADENIDVDFLGYKAVHENSFSDSQWLDSFDVPESIVVAMSVKLPIHLVVVRYSDGDTFGHTYGYWQIVHFTTSYAEASLINDSIQQAGGRLSPECNGNAYDSWTGSYFGRFQHTEIHSISFIED